MTTTKVIIIGAGWSGLVAARTYLRISELLNRPIDLTILDAYKDPGGVWSTSRLYPGLVANSPNGLYELSHLSMVDEKHPWFELLTGDRVQNYLEGYARNFDFCSKIRFDTRVVRARRRGSSANTGWLIETNLGDTIECDKLVVASGLYNKPRMPSIPTSTYTGVSIHGAKLGARNADLRADPAIKNIVIVGGCKSAVEACNVFLPTLNPDKKHRVSWVIRPSELGVPLVVQDVNKTGNIIAINQSRVFAGISPSIYCTTGFAYNFFHSGRWLLGTLLISWIWQLMSWALRRDAQYDISENGRKIKPTGASTFHDVNAISLIPKEHPTLQYLHKDDDSIFKVHRATPVQLQSREMVLMAPDGSTSTVPCDAVVWCTGWLPPIDFFSDEETKRLGLPTLLYNEPPSQHDSDASLANPKPPQSYNTNLTPAAKNAEDEVVSLFPHLGTARAGYPPPSTPYRLYNQCIPLSSFPQTSSRKPNPSGSEGVFDRSLVFTGLVSNSQTAICSELTALYSIAFLEDILPPSSLPSRGEAELEVERCLAFQRRRYGVKGSRDPEIILEVQSFLDMLCEAMGVEVYRKRRQVRLEEAKVGREGMVDGWRMEVRGWWREYCTPYFASDYEGVLEEMLAGNRHLTGKASELKS